MRKIIFGLAACAIVGAAILSNAGMLNRIPVQNGQATNGWIMDGTNRLYIVNQLLNTNDFDTGFGSMTNLATYMRAQAFAAPSTTIGMGVSGSAVGVAGTNPIIYTLQKSWDKTNWISWTNVSFQPPGVTNWYFQFDLTIGNYHYFRVYNISNTSVGAPTGAWRSNYLEFYMK